MSHEQLDKQILKYLFYATGFILFIIYFSSIMNIVTLLFSITFPLILGFVIAYILNIIITKVEKVYFPKSRNKIINQTKKIMVFLLSIIIILLTLIAIINIVLPEIFKTFSTITSSLPEFIDNINKLIIKYENYFPAIAEQIWSLDIDWSSIGKNIADYASKGISSLFNSSFTIVSSITGGIFDFVMAFAFAIYLVFGKERLIGQLKCLQKAYMKKSWIDKFNMVLSLANESFSNYIIGQVTEAVILGTLCSLGMWILRFPYALTIGVFVGITALIPIVGAYLGAGVGVFLILMIDPIKALFFLIFILILQQLENNLIYPRVVGTSIGLPGMWVLAAVVVGGGLFGVIGMIIGVPFAATVYKLIQIDVRKRLNYKKKRFN